MIMIAMIQILSLSVPEHVWVVITCQGGVGIKDNDDDNIMIMLAMIKIGMIIMTAMIQILSLSLFLNMSGW